MTLSLHFAEPSDYQALHGILQICGEHMHRTQNLNHWYPFRGYDQFEQEVQGAFVYKILEDNLLAGTFYLQPTPRAYYQLNMWENPEHSALYLGGVGVLPFTQGRGIGRWLMNRVDSVTQEKGYDAIRFDGVASNEGLLVFYDKLGYVRRGVMGEGTMREFSPTMLYEKVL